MEACRAPCSRPGPRAIVKNRFDFGPLNEGDYARACERARQQFGLNQLQAEAFVKFCREGRNLFLTGGAGVGKSHTAHTIIDHLHDVLVETPEAPGDPVGIVAPTGSAAQIASTRTTRAWTIHRYFCIKCCDRSPNELAARRREEPRRGRPHPDGA